MKNKLKFNTYVMYIDYIVGCIYFGNILTREKFELFVYFCFGLLIKKLFKQKI